VRLKKEDQNNKNQIMGASGVEENGHVLSNLKYRMTGEYITQYQIQRKEPVISLDECCFAIPKKILSELSFDEQNCFGWHLYAVDICYNSRTRYSTSISVLSEQLFHKEEEGGLSVDNSYLKTLNNLIHKYRKITPSLYTTCYQISTHPIPSSFSLIKYYCRNFVRKIINMVRNEI
jgi:hypothetical protein